MKKLCTSQKYTNYTQKFVKNIAFFPRVLEKKNVIVVDFIENRGENFRAFEVITKYVFLPLGYLTKKAYAHSMFY